MTVLQIWLYSWEKKQGIFFSDDETYCLADALYVGKIEILPEMHLINTRAAHSFAQLLGSIYKIQWALRVVGFMHFRCFFPWGQQVLKPSWFTHHIFSPFCEWVGLIWLTSVYYNVIFQEGCQLTHQYLWEARCIIFSYYTLKPYGKLHLTGDKLSNNPSPEELLSFLAAIVLNDSNANWCYEDTENSRCYHTYTPQSKSGLRTEIYTSRCICYCLEGKNLPQWILEHSYDFSANCGA